MKNEIGTKRRMSFESKRYGAVAINLIYFNDTCFDGFLIKTKRIFVWCTGLLQLRE